MSEFKEELKADVLDENGLTHKDNHFLEVLFDECKGNVPAAMKQAGISGSASAIQKRLHKEIKERAASYLGAHTAKAAISLVDAIDNPNIPGLDRAIKAAKEILDRGGVVKDETPVVKEQNFMFILPPVKESDDD